MEYYVFVEFTRTFLSKMDGLKKGHPLFFWLASQVENNLQANISSHVKNPISSG